MRDTRPVNIAFTTFRLPLPAITSFLHRVSGAFIFIGVAVLLYLLGLSLESPAGYRDAGGWINSLWGKLIVWMVLAGLIYHLVAGIRHLLMDMAIGDGLEGGLLGAQLVFVVSAIGIILAGVWLW
ncbi:MAG: succinate dehydrogenase, cytochrome b556 subunit [Pseudohongiellaceae bacterium]